MYHSTKDREASYIPITSQQWLLLRRLPASNAVRCVRPFGLDLGGKSVGLEQEALYISFVALYTPESLGNRSEVTPTQKHRDRLKCQAVVRSIPHTVLGRGSEYDRVYQSEML